MSQHNRDDETRVDRDDRTAATEDRDAATDRRDPNPGERGKWISALLALLGVWLVVQALMVDLTASQFWNDVAVGALLAAVGGYNYSRRSNEQLASTAAAVIAALVGLWLIAAPFMFGESGGLAETTNDVGFWNDILVGLLAFALGAYSAYKARDNREDARRTAA